MQEIPTSGPIMKLSTFCYSGFASKKTLVVSDSYFGGVNKSAVLGSQLLFLSKAKSFIRVSRDLASCCCESCHGYIWSLMRWDLFHLVGGDVFSPRLCFSTRQGGGREADVRR